MCKNGSFWCFGVQFGLMGFVHISENPFISIAVTLLIEGQDFLSPSGVIFQENSFLSFLSLFRDVHSVVCRFLLWIMYTVKP